MSTLLSARWLLSMLLLAVVLSGCAADPRSVTAPFADGQVDLAVDPGLTGTNAIHLYYLDANGRPREVTAPSLRLEHPGQVLDVPLSAAGPGHYLAQGQEFAHPGEYLISVGATVGGRALTADTSVTIR